MELCYVWSFMNVQHINFQYCVGTHQCPRQLWIKFAKHKQVPIGHVSPAGYCRADWESLCVFKCYFP